jgi:hypothetical protein
VKGGSTVIAFAKDPTGYMWELIQRPQTKEPLCQVASEPSCMPHYSPVFYVVLGACDCLQQHEPHIMLRLEVVMSMCGPALLPVTQCDALLPLALPLLLLPRR